MTPCLAARSFWLFVERGIFQDASNLEAEKMLRDVRVRVWPVWPH